jgi:hypothetical protein
MGADTAILVYADGPVAALLKSGSRDFRREAELVALVVPGQQVQDDGKAP